MGHKYCKREYLKVDTIEVHNAKEIATEFAKYFSTIGKNYANKINPSVTDINPTFKTYQIILIQYI